MLSVRHEILTYDPYRVVCDSCKWVSDSYSKLSQVSVAMTAHLKARHTPDKIRTPAPVRPSLILTRHATKH